MGSLTAAVSPLGRQRERAQPQGPRCWEGGPACPSQSKESAPQHLRLPRLPSPQSHPACVPARGAIGIREGSGFHKQEERRGGERHSALKIDLQALQRGPAPEIGGRGESWGAQSTPRKGGRVNGAPVCPRTPGAPGVLKRFMELSP